MTACAIDPAVTPAAAPAYAPAPALAIAADGSYAARLAGAVDARFPERWTLDGPEPYAVPLPLGQPEEPDSEVLALSDGRVLIHRRVADRHAFALLYPTGGTAAGPRTGELPLGGFEAAGYERVTLLPPVPDGAAAYALAVRAETAEVWRLTCAGTGPRRLAVVPGRCSGGVWLDREGLLLALDREQGSRTKAVAVDLGRGGEVTPLLQIAEDSEDRLLLADPDSGLLLIRSDAPGSPRLGWGVLGSARPVRFPECLKGEGSGAVPFAVQPGQILMPENCAVALRLEGDQLGLWRPADRHLFRLPAPAGWLGGAGRWTAAGVLCLPYATAEVPCGVVHLTVPQAPPVVKVAPRPTVARPVPLQQAPLTRR
ncbi:hypothetical protein LG634_30380 [Streptomyces bambusae]|uniref:hypothetical protein n=1 Tax=Streptomyces bambusae TaxID=1550616 RepID=UPI001CFF9A00|nr:hypothetical protein [Streptomyces bambusae]MCB5169102.1 hypothetical protein [Streptomyces bambusae]